MTAPYLAAVNPMPPDENGPKVPGIWSEMHRQEDRLIRRIERLEADQENHHRDNVGRLSNLERTLNQGLGAAAAARYLVHAAWVLVAAAIGFLVHYLTAK